MRLATRLSPILALCLLPQAIAAPPTAPTPQGGYHESPRFGFKFKAPRGWDNVALKTEEAWLAAKYMSDKNYFYTDEDTLWTAEHRPEMMVIAFIDENMKKREETVEEESEDGVTKKTTIIHNPYKNYEDFLERTYAGGGWYIDSKEETKVGDLEVTQYSIKVEKLARTGPKRILTWIWHTEDIDYAMQCEVLESEYKKLGKNIERAYRSFKLIPREGDLPTSGKTNDFIRIVEMTTGTPKERRTKRMESQELLHRRAVESLPEDWDHKKHGSDLLVLHHDQEKWAERLGDHAVAFLKWVDKTFTYVGHGEYVRAPIIRVCKDREEESSFGRGTTSGSGGYWFTVGGDEIYTHKDNTGFAVGYEVGFVNRQLFVHWMMERDRDLTWAMPQWLSGGLSDYVDGARAKGRSIDFRVDDYDRDNARLAVAQHRATSPRELMKATRAEFTGSSTTGSSGYWNNRAQAAMLVRFLLSPESRRCKQAKDLLEGYVSNLKLALEEAEKKDSSSFKEDKPPETEEEEAERAKRRAENLRSREKELMDDVFFRTFRDWTEKDWESFEKAYFDFIG